MTTQYKIFLGFGLAALVLGAASVWYTGAPAPTFLPPPPDMRTVGEVVSVDEDTITVAVLTYQQGTATPTKGKEKIFSISEGAHIWAQELRDRATFEAELKAYQASNPVPYNPTFSTSTLPPPPPPPPPTPFVEKLLTLEDIKLGSIVTITPQVKDSLVATDILVITPPSKATVPAAPVSDAAPTPKP